ncbi:MAG: hypothetical protein IJZ47_10420 [Oscillospiraceae bacterium]|nr:hypothetical protein [Oscillospiraceae bacterium]
MKELYELFAKTKTPHEWKSRLYDNIGSTARHGRTIGRTAIMIAAAAICSVCAVTVAAESGLINIAGILGIGFGDKISESKVESGEYQTPSVFADDDVISVGLTAFLGDTYDYFALLEVRTSEEYSDCSGVSLGVVVVDENTEDISSYAIEQYSGVRHTLDDGSTVHFVKAKLPAHWPNAAADNDGLVSLRIVNASFDINGTTERINTDIRLDFKPQSDVISDENTIKLEKTLLRNGLEYNVDRFCGGDYRSRVYLEYYVPESMIEENGGKDFIWYSGVLYGRNALGLDLTLACEEPEASSPVKLIVDGNEIPYSADFRAVELMNRNASQDDEFILSNHFICELSFEPVDIDEAESVIIEIAAPDGTTDIVTVK